jgi:hypothetical protein
MIRLIRPRSTTSSSVLALLSFGSSSSTLPDFPIPSARSRQSSSSSSRVSMLPSCHSSHTTTTFSPPSSTSSDNRRASSTKSSGEGGGSSSRRKGSYKNGDDNEDQWRRIKARYLLLPRLRSTNSRIEISRSCIGERMI